MGSGIPAPLQAGVRASLGTVMGPTHSVNQDTIAHLPGHFSGVADGVGGGTHGEVASRLLMQSLPHELPIDAASAHACLLKIDQRISEALQALGDGPGATVFAAVWPLADRQAWQVLWVGDCQVTHYRPQAAQWQVVWQSQAQTYRSSQMDPPAGVDGNAPNNMVGCGLSCGPAWHELCVRPGDRIVLASDGFHQVFSDHEQLALMAQSASPLLWSTASSWCQQARAKGSQDDVSVLILEMVAPPWPRRLAWLLAVVSAALACGLWWWGPLR